MCLLIALRKEHVRNGTIAEDVWKDYVSVAQQDITVYKILEKTVDGLVSPYERHRYEVGQTVKADFTFSDHATSHIGYTRVYDNLPIYRGLHTYSTIEGACLDVGYDRGEVVCEFMIPRGSLVFKAGEEICSNEVKFVEVLAYAG